MITIRIIVLVVMMVAIRIINFGGNVSELLIWVVMMMAIRIINLGGNDETLKMINLGGNDGSHHNYISRWL